MLKFWKAGSLITEIDIWGLTDAEIATEITLMTIDTDAADEHLITIGSN